MDLFGEEPAPEPEIEEETADVPEPEALPESSRTALYALGHEEQEKELLSFFYSGRMPHAIIFSGPQGIGKATMAFRLARFLLSHKQGDAPVDNMDMEPSNPVFRRVASGGHPDLLSVGREYDSAKGKYKNSVAVEDIRKVAPFLRMTASGGGWRVVVIDDADTMTHSSQNAILKILEEPPANTVLIVIAHRAGALIPTIRSRARMLHFHPLQAGPMKELLQSHGHYLSEEETLTLARLSGGSFGKALSYIEEGGLEILGQTLELLQSYPDWDWPQIHVMADDLSRPGRDQAYTSFAAIMPWVAEQLAVSKARGMNQPQQPLDIAALTGLMQNSSLESLGKICENLQSHFDKVHYANLDKRHGVLGAFSLLKQAA